MKMKNYLNSPYSFRLDCSEQIVEGFIYIYIYIYIFKRIITNKQNHN
jgi:hypothetical protein